MTGFDLLAIILSITLAIFLILAIILTIYLIRIVRQVQTVMNQAESTVDLIKSSVKSLTSVGIPRSAFRFFTELLSKKSEMHSKGKKSK
ncbi:MAG TPA: hypothetical protein VGS28_02650 [Candidatus Saccharimonadales bacterium]|nr:hypothetical protein [Candidatus Saccharimonadales bacterium]